MERPFRRILSSENIMSAPLHKEAEVREFPKKVTTGPLPATTAPLYFNRELSLLEFHARVFEEAMEPSNPLLERLKFLGIFASNLDEFFMIRVSGLKEELEQSITTLSPDGMTPADQLLAIKRRLLPLLDLQEEWTKRVLNELRDKGIVLASFESLSRREKEGLKEYFTEIVFPVLTPLAVDPSHPFPYISPLSLNLGVMVDVLPDSRTGDPKLDEPRFVRIKVPSEIIPRLVPVGSATTKFVLLEELIEEHIEMLFPGMKAGECHRFRVTRDADIEIREEEAQDLLRVIQEELRQRRFGTPVRLEVSSSMPAELVNYLAGSLELDADYVYRTAAPLAVQDLSALYDLDRDDLKDTPFAPTLPDWFTHKRSIFDVIKEGDRLLHHPFDSYDCVTGFINQAVDDPDVVAIKICLYRTGPDSPIPPALIRASEQGKQVTVLIELKARFDEEHNIEWAQKLDRAGVHVVYGVLGLKTHGKLTLVVRREGDSLRRYVHIASGNYNPTTSCTYTDLGMFTADDAIGRDATELFNYLTGFSRQVEYRKLMVAPINLRDRLNALFDREIQHKRDGRPARIIAKFNRLADLQIVNKLYEVSKAGVEVDLIVRGICMLRPGIPGLSDNITVRSVVGRFLEHSRVFYFENGGEEEIYIGSADWMARNLKHRIEVVVPVAEAGAKDYLRNVLLDAYLRDNSKARELQSDGSYALIPRASNESFDSQAYFIGLTS